MEFRLLGRLEVTADGVDLTPTRPKQRALLAYLLLRAEEVVSSDDLVHALWGEEPPETASTALHGHISALRRRLGPDRIETRRPGYVLRLVESDEVDVRRFQRLVAEVRPQNPAARVQSLREMLAEFRGEPLSEFRSEAFAAGDAARLEELRVMVAQQLIEAEMELGHHVAVVPQLERLIAEHPLREGLRAQLMLALYRAGRQSDALNVAQEARRILAEDLGVEPGPALRQLEQQILNQDRRLAVPAIRTLVPPPAVPTKPTGIVTLMVADIESSRRTLLQPAELATAAADSHRELVRTLTRGRGGFEVDAVGGRLTVAFPRARDAAISAADIQRASRTLPVPTRIGIHSTELVSTAGGYAGPGIRTAAHIARAAHGGQILLSQATRDLLREAPADEADVLDLGEHRLTDLERARPLYQLLSPGLEGVFPPPMGLDAHPTNLPIQTAALIGRDREIASITELLSGSKVRLLTLTGPGGTGKTRLALHSAAVLVDEFAGGVFVVDLAPLTEPGLVVPSIAHTLGISEAAGEPLAATLARQLRSRPILVVLDNFEHLLGAAQVLGELVAGAPGLRVLATSRVPLHLQDERVFPVSPLETPLAADTSERVASVDSVALFALRAQAVRPEFTVGTDNAEAVAGICRVLDGLPLAIELAAARIGVLAPSSLLEHLGRHVPAVLTSRDSGAPDRHRTLEKTIDWSHDLLEPDEKSLLARLAVFSGGCTLEAAGSICGDDLDVIEGLASLVDHSLLGFSESDAGPRFTMLDTIRAYADRRLQQSGEAEHRRRLHAGHYLDLAEEAEAHLRGSPGEWLEVLEREHDNLRAALDWLQSAGSGQRALRLAGALWRFWYLRGHLTEGALRLADVLRTEEAPTAARGKALIGAAVMAVNQGEFATAVLRAQEGIALHRTVDDPWGEAYCQFMLGAAVGSQGDHGRAQRLYEESIETFRELGDEHTALLVTRNLASTCGSLGDSERQRRLLDDNLRRARASHNQRIEASTLGELANMTFEEGRIQDAIWMLNESLRIHHHLGDRLDTAVDLCRAARAAAFAGKAGTAVRLVASVAGSRSELGFRRSWVAEMNEETLATARRQLDDDAFAEAWRQGERLTIDEAVPLALTALS